MGELGKCISRKGKLNFKIQKTNFIILFAQALTSSVSFLPPKMKLNKCFILILLPVLLANGANAILPLLGAVFGPAITTGILSATGFTASGITGGSIAAGIMSSYGGYVASGSACAIMQSIGAAGLGMAGTAASAAAGGIAGIAAEEAMKEEDLKNVRWSNKDEMGFQTRIFIR